MEPEEGRSNLEKEGNRKSVEAKKNEKRHLVEEFYQLTNLKSKLKSFVYNIKIKIFELFPL